MVVVGVHLKKKKHPLQSEATTLPPLHHSYSSCTYGNIGILKWRNWIRGRKKKSFIFLFHNKVASSIKTDCQRYPGEREIPKLCTYSLEIWCACSHFQFLSSFFNPQNTLITKMTNFPRVVEWGCLVMLLPTQVSQQTSGDSICFLSDLRARWEPSCILTKPEPPSVCYLQVSVVYQNPGVLTLEVLLKHRKPNNTRNRDHVSWYLSEAEKVYTSSIFPNSVFFFFTG